MTKFELEVQNIIEKIQHNTADQIADWLETQERHDSGPSIYFASQIRKGAWKDVVCWRKPHE